MADKAKQKEKGRPTKYKIEFNEQARKLSLLGANDDELADFFQVNIDTITEWKKKHPQFSVSVMDGKVKADAEVADSMYKRAKGYVYQETSYERIADKIDEKEGKEIITPQFKKRVITKEMPPDAGAALNWLKNRQHKKWRDKQEVKFTFEEDQVFEIGGKQIKF